MNRRMAVYTDKASSIETAWHYTKLTLKTVFAFGIGYLYLIIGFSL